MRNSRFHEHLQKVACVLLLSILVTPLQAQDMISGQVTSADDGSALPGTTIQIKGTSTGTITDVDGSYSLEASSSDVLVFSFIGFLPQEVQVGTQSVINVSLEYDVLAMEEVVVVGYGTQKKKDLTSAISVVKAEELAKTPTGQTMQALQGKVAGVQIVSSGSPGSEATVRIRGIGSYSSQSQPPLYVVNGALYNNIDFLNPAEIESISVLKDASASAIYGVRAANGVILVTTKGGKFNSEATITYDGYYGLQVPTNVLEMADAEQFIEYVNQTGSAADISYIDQAFQVWGRSYSNPDLPAANTDWYKEIMEPAPQQNHALNISGGNESTAYAFGLSYFDQDGLLKMKNSYNRMNITARIDQKVNSWFKAGVNINSSRAIRYLGQNGAWFRAYHAVPIMPVTDENNYEDILNSDLEFARNASIYASAQQAGYRGSQNPFITLKYNEDRQEITKIQSGIYGELTFIPDKLTFKTTYNAFMMFLRSRGFDSPYYITNESHRDYSFLSAGRTNTMNHYLDNILTYNQSFGVHNTSAMVGTSFRDEGSNTLSGSVEGIPEQEFLWYVNRNFTELYDDTRNVNEIGSRYYGLSYFGRLSYNYDNRYIAYFTLRRDGSHKYQEKWGTFPAFGLGWVISEESFFQGVGFVDFLKLRGGWGKLGTDLGSREDGANSVNQVSLAIDDQQVTGSYSTSTFGYLGWEVVVGTNIGITAELLNNRLTIDADYYIRNTENAIIPVSLKLQAGSVRRNSGGIRNSGIEMTFDWNDQISSNLSYTAGLNLAYNKNEVTDLYGQEYLNAGSAEFRQRSEVGEPLFSFYGYETAGVYQNLAEIESDSIAISNGLVPGDLRFRDQNKDGIIDDDDKVYLGSYFPSLTYGGYVGLNYKSWSFSLAFMGQQGNKILNRKRGEIIWTNDTNIDADLASGLWNGEGTSNKYPSASGLRRGWNQNFSDYIVEDGSFFRIQNIQVAYTFSNHLFFEGMPRTRIYATAERPLTLFKYNGFNPEIPNGIDRQFYPIPAIYNLGVNLQF